MTRGGLAAATCGDVRPPIELRVEDRLESLAAPIRRMSAWMVAVLIGSLVVHAGLLATTLIGGWTAPPVAQREIAVEIVQDAPKPPAAKAPMPQKLAEAAKPPAPTLQKTEPPQPTPPKAAPPKTAAAKPVPPPPPAVPQAPPHPEVDEAKALQAELASLKAEQASLKAAAQAQGASGMALALPAITGDDGDVVGYQELVFSRLAKAKGDSEYKGKTGVAGIRFEMDAAGQLVHADVVTPSGDPALDAKALDIVHRAAPFPPPPTDADRIVFANVNFIAPKPQ